MKLDATYKITISGLLLALIIIFTRFLSLQNIPVIPFVRISLGPGLIIFSSIFLGPIYGGIIGGLSDILGILLVPNSLGYSINPWLTLVYTFLGILPWCIYQIFKRVKSEKIMFIIFSSILLALWIFILIYGLTHDSVSSHVFELYEKILIFVISFVLFMISDIGIYFIGRYFKKKTSLSVMNIAFTCLISEIIVLLILNSFVKSFFFEINFWIIFFAQSVVFFIDIPLNTFLVSYLLKITAKIFLKGENNG